MKITKSTKLKDIQRKWHLVDVGGKILGREASKIAQLLMGKSKPNFVRNLDVGDYVVVINSKKIKVTGNKENLKKYFRHSGYPGGFKAETFSNLLQRKPQEIIKHAVSGMLPQNRLKKSMLKRLYVFPDNQHTFLDKFKS
jgi:large subunit ribosomal protein L13